MRTGKLGRSSTTTQSPASPLALTAPSSLPRAGTAPPGCGTHAPLSRSVSSHTCRAAVASVAFSPDGHSVTADWTGRVRVFACGVCGPVDELQRRAREQVRRGAHARGADRVPGGRRWLGPGRVWRRSCSRCRRRTGRRSRSVPVGGTLDLERASEAHSEVVSERRVAAVAMLRGSPDVAAVGEPRGKAGPRQARSARSRRGRASESPDGRARRPGPGRSCRGRARGGRRARRRRRRRHARGCARDRGGGARPSGRGVPHPGREAGRPTRDR